MRVVFVVFVALLLAGCGSVPSPSATTTTAKTSPCKPADLMTCVMPMPAATKAADGFGMGRPRVGTGGGLVGYAFDTRDVPKALDRYRQLGLRGVAHRGWQTESLTCEVILLDFATPDAATADVRIYE